MKVKKANLEAIHSNDVNSNSTTQKGQIGIKIDLRQPANNFSVVHYDLR